MYLHHQWLVLIRYSCSIVKYQSWKSWCSYLLLLFVLLSLGLNIQWVKDFVHLYHWFESIPLFDPLGVYFEMHMCLKQYWIQSSEKLINIKMELSSFEKFFVNGCTGSWSSGAVSDENFVKIKSFSFWWMDMCFKSYTVQKQWSKDKRSMCECWNLIDVCAGMHCDSPLTGNEREFWEVWLPQHIHNLKYVLCLCFLSEISLCICAWNLNVYMHLYHTCTV